MTEQEHFVRRLQRHRKWNRVSLAQISEATCIKQELLEGLERNDLSQWPRGLYARAYMRAYASTIGLDVEDTVDDFCRLFSQGDRRAEPTIKEMATIVASDSGWRDEFRHVSDMDRRSPAINLLPRRSWLEAIGVVVLSAARTLWRRPAREV